MSDFSSRLTQAMGQMQAPELATRTNVTKQTVYNILDGVTKPEKVRAVTLFDMAATLGVTPQWLLYGRGAANAPSQAARPDPTILAQTQEFLETAFAFQGKSFDLRTDPDLFADAYEWLAEDERPIDERNLVHFGRWLAGRHQANEAADEDEGGRVAGKVASSNRGRAARTA